jgi:hypothetical protein
VSHQNLGIDRLEDARDLVRYVCIDELRNGKRLTGHRLLFSQSYNPRPVLGGTVDVLQSSERCMSLRFDRDGFRYVSQTNPDRHIPLSSLLTGIGSALSGFECLRAAAGAPTMPAEIEVEILALPSLCLMISDTFPETRGLPLGFKTQFPTTTVADLTDISINLREILLTRADFHQQFCRSTIFPLNSHRIQATCHFAEVFPRMRRRQPLP